MHKSIIVGLSLLLIQSMSYASSSESDGEDFEHAFERSVRLKERQFKDGQDYRAAKLKEERKYHQSQLSSAKRDQALRAAELAEQKRRDALLAKQVRLQEQEAADRRQAEEERREKERRLKTAKDRKQAEAEASAAAEREWEQDLAEATDFVAQWAKVKSERWDVFMRTTIGQWQRGVPLSEKTVDELLQRRDTILKALEIGENRIRTKTYKDQQDREKIQRSIDAGVVGLTYANAQATLEDERIAREEAEREERYAQEQARRARLEAERKAKAAERKAKITYLEQARYSVWMLEGDGVDLDRMTLSQIKKKFPQDKF
jgi:hypothetical protein